MNPKKLLLGLLTTLLAFQPVVSNFISPSKVLGQESPPEQCRNVNTSVVNRDYPGDPTNSAPPVGPAPLAQPGYAGPGGDLARWIGIEAGKLTVEKGTRAAFTQEYVNKAAEQCPDYNVVISHNGGEVTGDHVSHEHYELEIGLGHTVGYEIYFSPKGQPFTFVRNGDGDFINWAYNGDFTRTSDNTITAN